MSFRPSCMVTLGLALLGCGPATPPQSVAAETVAAPDDRLASDRSVLEGPSFDVHEWGLIDVYPDGLVEVGAGPGPRTPQAASPTAPSPPERVARKPVLYVHADATQPPFVLETRVTMDGTVLERWPTPAEGSGGTLLWRGRVQPCGVRRPLPSDTESVRQAMGACAAPDGVCELTELDRYVTRESACLSVAGTDVSLLFYRGQLAPGTTLPMRVTGRSLARDGRLHGATLVIQGARVAVVADPPAILDLDRALDEHAASMDVARETLRADLRALALTDQEVAAFLAAWDWELFGAMRDAREVRSGIVVLTFLPRADVDRLFATHFVPSPRRFERAFVVRHHVH